MLAVTVTVHVPSLVTLPVISPDVLICSPVGRLAARKVIRVPVLVLAWTWSLTV